MTLSAVSSHIFFFFFLKTESAHAHDYTHINPYIIHVNAHNKPYTQCRRGINQVHTHHHCHHPHTQGSSSHTHKLQGPLRSQDRTQGPPVAPWPLRLPRLKKQKLEWNVYACGSFEKGCSKTPSLSLYYYYRFTINISWINCNSERQASSLVFLRPVNQCGYVVARLEAGKVPLLYKCWWNNNRKQEWPLDWTWKRHSSARNRPGA